MSRAATRSAAGRAVGAQSVKAMLLAIGEAEDKASELTDEIPPPVLLAPIIEAHVAAANTSGVASFRSGFYEALAEWLAPTVECGTICRAANWQPLAEKVEAPPDAPETAGSSAPAPAAPLKVSAAEAGVILDQIAMIALTASGLAAQATEAAGRDLALAEKVHATQKLLELIGALADSATSSRVRGSLNQWCYEVRS